MRPILLSVQDAGKNAKPARRNIIPREELSIHANSRSYVWLPRGNFGRVSPEAQFITDRLR